MSRDNTPKLKFVSGQEIIMFRPNGDEYEMTVLYVSEDRKTMRTIRKDSIINNYGVHSGVFILKDDIEALRVIREHYRTLLTGMFP